MDFYRIRLQFPYNVEPLSISTGEKLGMGLESYRLMQQDGNAVISYHNGDNDREETFVVDGEIQSWATQAWFTSKDVATVVASAVEEGFHMGVRTEKREIAEKLGLTSCLF